MRFLFVTSALVSAVSAADPCGALCKADGPKVCTKGSWTEKNVCKYYMFVGNPADMNYCYHTTETAAVCPSGLPIKPEDVEGLLAKKSGAAPDLRGRKEEKTAGGPALPEPLKPERPDEVIPKIYKVPEPEKPLSPKAQEEEYERLFALAESQGHRPYRFKGMGPTLMKKETSSLKTLVARYWIEPDSLPVATVEEMREEEVLFRSAARKVADLMLHDLLAFPFGYATWTPVQRGRELSKLRAVRAKFESEIAREARMPKEDRSARVAVLRAQLERVNQEFAEQGLIDPKIQDPVTSMEMTDRYFSRVEEWFAEKISKLRHEIRAEYIDPATFPDTTFEELTAERQRLEDGMARAKVAGVDVPVVWLTKPEAWMNKAQLGRIAVEYARRRAILVKRAPAFF